MRLLGRANAMTAIPIRDQTHRDVKKVSAQKRPEGGHLETKGQSLSGNQPYHHLDLELLASRLQGNKNKKQPVPAA